MNKTNTIKKMNKKGQIAFHLLFPVAIALVVATLFIFASFSSGYKDISLSNSKMLSKIDFGEKYVLSIAKLVAKETIDSNPSNLELKFQELANKSDYQIYEAGNFFGKIRLDDGFDFGKSKVDENYVLKIEDLFVQAEVETEEGYSEMTRNFDLCMIFDSKGEYLEEVANKEIYEKNC